MSKKVSRSLDRLCVAAVAAMFLGMTSAHAEVVDIVWDISGSFQRDMEIAPGKFAEVCGRLRKGQAVAWSFKSDTPMDFNIHYHEGSNVVVPAKRDQTASLDGSLVAPTDQDYCWMWQNGSGSKNKLSVGLRSG